MRMARLLGISGRDDTDIAGVAIDAAMGLLAGLALILAIWLLADALRPEAARAAPLVSAASQTVP